MNRFMKGLFRPRGNDFMAADDAVGGGGPAPARAPPAPPAPGPRRGQWGRPRPPHNPPRLFYVFFGGAGRAPPKPIPAPPPRGGGAGPRSPQWLRRPRRRRAGAWPCGDATSPT